MLKEKNKKCNKINVVDEIQCDERQEKTTSKKRKFDLAWALGKSQTDMEKDFYVFEIKELVKKMGCYISAPLDSDQDLIDQVFSMAKYGVKDVLLTPYTASMGKEAFTKAQVEGAIAIDYPYGESVDAVRKKAIKESVKLKAKDVIIFISTSILAFEPEEKIKKKISKLSKIAKGNLTVGISVLDEFKSSRLLKILCDCGVRSVLISASSCSMEIQLSLVKKAIEYKGKKKLYLLSDLNSVVDLARFTELGVDKVFTPYVGKIIDELSCRFQVDI